MILLLLSVITFVTAINALIPIKKTNLRIASFILAMLSCEFAIYWALASLIIAIVSLIKAINGSFFQNLATEVLTLSLSTLAAVLFVLYFIVSTLSTKRKIGNLNLTSMGSQIAKTKGCTKFTRKSFKKIKNLSYAQDSNKRHMLDLYIPQNLQSPAPVLLFIHGGAWVIGNKEHQGKPLLKSSIKHGIIVGKANYCLSPQATWPEHIIDVKRAIAYLKSNIENYGGNKELIIIAGNSAGGHLASLAALSANDKTFQPGFEESDTSIAGCIALYGVYDLLNSNQNQDVSLIKFLAKNVFKTNPLKNPEPFKAASPLFRISDKAPAFFIIHGKNDSLVDFRDAKLLYDKLTGFGHPNTLYLELPLAQHAFDLTNSTRTKYVLRAVTAFINELPRT